MNRSNLASLGWDAWFEDRARGGCDRAEGVARVAAVDRDHLLLLDGESAYRGKLSGRFLHEAGAPLDRPAVGDWVWVARLPGEALGVVHGVVERKSGLRRKAAGEVIEHQMIAANVDVVFIVQSCHFDFNLRRLERYLVMVRAGEASPCILLTKTDLVAPEVVAGQLEEIRHAGIDVPVRTLSNVTREGVDELRELLQPGQTYCFVGSSGVGKSTLINGLLGRDRLATQGVSGTGEGRHTTVRRELLRLEGGALVIDNPGMRELGMLAAESGIDASYSEIAELATRCRFRDCAHGNEPGCAVRAAVASGQLAEEQLASYLKLKDESEFLQMSYSERRQRERDFGRFVHAAMKRSREN